MHYLGEAIVVAILVLLVGLLMTSLIGMGGLSWTTYTGLAVVLLGTGFATHVSSEMLGVNEWYCAHGCACQRHT
jgi:hypothetical protein